MQNKFIFINLVLTLVKFNLSIEIPFKEIDRSIIDESNLNAELPINFENLLVKELKLNIGTPLKKAKFILDSGSHVTWVYTGYSQYNNYEPKDSSSYVDYKDTLSLKYGSLETRVDLGSDILQFDGIEKTFSFTIGTTKSVTGTKPDGIIGLPYFNSQGYDYDFLYALKKSNIISSSKFAITYDKPDEGHFYIGENPPEIVYAKENNKEIGKCDILALDGQGFRSIHFTCLLDGLMLTSDEESYRDVNELIIVDSGTTYNYVSEQTLSFINTKYADLIAKGECEKQYSGIVCKKDSYDELKPIFLVFENKAIQFDLSTCFYKNDSLFDSFKFKACFLPSSKSSIFSSSIGYILGASFIKKIISVHDRENKVVEFYAENKILSLSKNYSHNKLSRKVALILSIILYVLSIIAIVILRLKVMKYENTENEDTVLLQYQINNNQSSMLIS